MQCCMLVCSEMVTLTPVTDAQGHEMCHQGLTLYADQGNYTAHCQKFANAHLLLN